jgi:formyltetrahydrofolate deformylase
MKIFNVLIACEDQSGLVHKITGVLFRYGLNIINNQEHVDHLSGRFFMRTQIEGDMDTVQVRKDLDAILPKSAFCEIRSLRPQKIIVLASKEPHCLGDLLLRNSTEELNAEILAVVSQVDHCQELTERFAIPFHHIPVDQMDREGHEKKILEIITPYQPDYLVLARYMRIFSEKFISNFPDRIINIHHSFLPAFIGSDPYHQAYERGVKMIGATAHFVTQDLDEGPIINQGVVPVNHTLEPNVMARRGQDVEKVVLANAVNLVFEDRVLIDGRRTIVFE